MLRPSLRALVTAATLLALPTAALAGAPTPTVDQLLRQAQLADSRTSSLIVEVDPNLAPDTDALAQSGAQSRDISADGSQMQVVVPSGSAADAVEALRHDPAVRSVEADTLMHWSALQAAPNDPLAAEQWSLGAMRWFDAQVFVPVGKVAFLDSGIDLQHPDLNGTLPDGRPKIAATWNSMSRTSIASDNVGHGTATSAVATAFTGNGEGIAGVSPLSQLMMVKVGDMRGVRLSDAIEGLNWAVARGARVVNISFGNTSPSPAFRNAILEAADKGVTIVAAVGNDGCAEQFGANQLQFPAGYPHVIGVAASTRQGTIACFSNYGPEVDVAAPGADIRTAVARGDLLGSLQDTSGYSTVSGTSLAAPAVTAAVALLQARHPTWNPAQVQAALETTAKDVGRKGRDNRSGWGIVDLAAALATPLSGARDFQEINDDIAFARANQALISPARRKMSISAHAHRTNDTHDLYRVRLRRGQTLRAALGYKRGPRLTLSLWRPQTASVYGNPQRLKLLVAAEGKHSRGSSRLTFKVPASGTYFLDVIARDGGGEYRLTTVRS